MEKKNDDRVSRLLVAATILAAEGSSTGRDTGSDDLDQIVDLAERAAALKRREMPRVVVGSVLSSSDGLSASGDSN